MPHRRSDGHDHSSQVIYRAKLDLTDAEQRMAFAMHAAVKSGQSVEFWLDRLESIIPHLREQLLLQEAGK